MKALMKFCDKTINKKLITLNIILWSVYYLIAFCEVSIERAFCSVRDLALSLYYWFVVTATRFRGSSDAVSVNVTVNDIPNIDIQRFIPFDINEFVYRLKNLHLLVFDSQNFLEFNADVFLFTYRLTVYVLFFFIIFMLFGLMAYDILVSENDKENGEITKKYIKYQDLYYSKIRPAYLAVKDYVLYFMSLPGVVILFCIIWLLSFNIISIAIEFFSYYFYFLASFDPASLFVQAYKLILDVAIMLNAVPLWTWILVGIVAYCIIAVNVGLDRLRHGEAKNCGVVKALDLVVLFVGPMGSGKTTLATDVALSCNNIQKSESLDIMFKYDMLFPEFSWELFEKDLQREISAGHVYNLPSVKKYVEQLEKEREKWPELFPVVFNYDKRMPVTTDIGTVELSLFDAMFEYGKAYFVYTCDNPNLANYSIRLDGYHDESPFFQKWCGDFFQANKSKSKYCHILDQDIMRPGKLVDPENKYAGSFGFGIYNNTEWGKSRLNQVNLEGVKKDAEETNQKNDLYDYLIKMVRHASVMIDNKVFFRFIADEQRPESIPASLRDVVTVVQIVSKSEMKNALPGFFIMDKLYDLVYEPVKDTYYEYRNKRGDRSAATFILKGIVSAFSNFYLRAYNNFGYYDVELECESGRAFGNNGSVTGANRYTYQLAAKKIYSERYSTDCYQQFFEKKQLDCEYGINDYPCYEELKMSVEEMKQQHDYFLMEIMDIMLGDKAPAEKPIKKTKKQTKEKDVFYSNNVSDDDDCDNFF